MFMRHVCEDVGELVIGATVLTSQCWKLRRGTVSHRKILNSIPDVIGVTFRTIRAVARIDRPFTLRCFRFRLGVCSKRTPDRY
jgi:hypothetical protein